PDAVLARQLRQDRAEPRAVHLAVHFVREVLVRRIWKNLAAAAPQRARGHAGAGAAGAFLPPRLLGGVVDRAAILLRARAKARVCLERDHDLVPAARAGHRALDEQELPPGIDADDLQIQDRAAHVAEVAGHALAGKHARRALVLAGRAGLVMRDRVAVAGAVGREMMALDHAGETLADRDALDVHLLADLEDLEAALAADLLVCDSLRPCADSAQALAL